ncbi:unnamed protein product [Caenorhabditis sp. 36 PRJEB53466]|nr:unnamed protein product [Caenorhabditis sp. 36 PRJEB53466]
MERERGGFGAERAGIGKFKFCGGGGPPEPLSTDNKGAQLMVKMGWSSGKGLGSQESGIIHPVSGGEVRDRNDQFSGLGRTLDPYEQFRKQRSGTYHDRTTFGRK